MIQIYKTPEFKEQGEYITKEIITGKILKVFVELEDSAPLTIKLSTSEGEVFMNREFKESDCYKPLDVIVEGSVYDKFISAGPISIEIIGSVSEKRPLKPIQIFYE